MDTEREILRGKPVSPGIALAKAYIYRPLEIHVSEKTVAAGGEQEQLGIFERVCTQAKAELDELCERLGVEDASKAKIFAAHREILDDEEVLAEIRHAITVDRKNAAAAIDKVYGQFAELLAGVADPLIAERAADLYDVRDRLLRLCMGKKAKDLSALCEDVIIVAHDLCPSDTATMDRAHVKGIVTETGGTNSHSAILARSFQIPAILGVENAVSLIKEGSLLAMDAISGELFPEPTSERAEAFEEKRRCFLAERTKEEQYRDRSAVMADGTKLLLGMNIGGTEFDMPGDRFDFIGLFRTEFLYMEASALPDEEAQFSAYRRVVEHANGHTVTLRTLDIGGDKTLPYMELPKEENPFLGKRALRLCFDEAELFQTQLRAALRASAFGSLQIMFPMVGGMEDIARAKQQLEMAKRTLSEKGFAFDPNIRTGIMIEVPSIALIADMAAEEVDFASIGSNDLTQYVCAADRMNPGAAEYYQNLSPAMLRLLSFVFAEFNRRGKEICVCGEMAGNPKAAVLLAGLGARRLSMSAANDAGVKAALAGVSLKTAEDIAQRCMQMRTEKEIIEYLETALR